MDVIFEWATHADWAGIVLPALIGGLGILLSIRANSLAKKSNDDIKVANRSAAQAVIKADEANRIAEHANKLAEEANEVIALQAARESEQHVVDWKPERDLETARLVLVNRGPHVAHDALVRVTVDSFREFKERQGDTPPGGHLVVPLPQAFDAPLSEDHERITRFTSRGKYPPGYDYFEVQVEIYWRSPLGKPHQDSQSLSFALRRDDKTLTLLPAVG